MAKVAEEILSKLHAVLNDVASDLSHVVEKTMFGCRSLFAKDSIFSLVWKEGRIGVRLPDKEAFSKLIEKTGAAPWKAGSRTMSHWVLVPESMHNNQAELARWVAKAHAYAIGGIRKSQPTRKKPQQKPRAAAGKSSTASRPTTKMSRVRRKSRSK